MHGVALLLAAAAAASVVARLLRAPAIPILIAGGVVLRAIHPPEEAFLETTLILGVSFLLFVAGLELDPRRVRAQRRAARWVGLAQFVVLVVLGYGASRLLGFDDVSSAWIALALPASSTLLGVRLLQRRRQMFEPFGRLTLGTLLVQDALILLAIPVMIGASSGPRSMIVGLVGVLLLAGAALVVRRWIGRALVQVMDEHEVILLGALAILFAFIGGAAAMGLPIVVGAFLAGVSLSRFPVSGIVRAEVFPIGDFFVAIFFTTLGALVRLPTQPELVAAIVLGLLVLLVTPPLVMFLAERAGFTSKPAIEAGLLLAQTSEISLVVVLAGMTQGVIGEEVFVVVAMVTMGTMLLTPLISTDEAAHRLAMLRPGGGAGHGEHDAPSGHVLLVGVGTTGMPLLEDLILTGCTVAVIDHDPTVTRVVEEAGIHAVRGEVTDPRVLRVAGVPSARAICTTVRRPRDNAELLRIADGVPVLVRVFEEEDAEWVRARGGTPILYSEATAEGLMEWYEENRHALASAPIGSEPPLTRPHAE